MRQAFVAPELSSTGFSVAFKPDIYGLGVLLYYMLTEKFPHPEDNVRAQSFEFSADSPFSQDLQKIVSFILKYDPKDRPSVDDILTQPIVAQALEEVELKDYQP